MENQVLKDLATLGEMEEFKKSIDDFRDTMLKGLGVPVEMVKGLRDPSSFIELLLTLRNKPMELRPYKPALFNDDKFPSSFAPIPRVLTAKPFPCVSCGADEVEGMRWMCHSEKHHPKDYIEKYNSATHYKCAVCGGVFEKGVSDEEAEAELANNFPGMDKSECGIVCDDCYNQMPVQEWQKDWNERTESDAPKQ